MRLTQRIRNFATEFVVDRMVALAARKSGDPLARLIKMAGWITRDPLWAEVVEGGRVRLENNHPGMEVARRFLRDVSPKVRSTLLRNLIVKGTLLGPGKRHAIEDELGYYPPSFFVISPSMTCPLNCYGCYAGSYTKDEQLSYEEVGDLIQQGKDMGMHFVVLSGGEPFAWEPLMQILRDHQDVAFQIYTSGLLLTDKVVDEIAKLGNVIPAISCEGFEEETDRRRGKGAFKKVLRAMSRLKEHGCAFAFSATVTRENLDVVTGEEFVDFWSEQGCILGWYFTYIPIGREPHLELMPTPEQRVEMSRRIKAYRSAKPIFLADFWNDGEHTGGCIAGGRKYFHVNNKGDVEPCVFCHFATENIRNKPLREILGSDFFRRMRAEQPYHEDLRRPCIIIDNPHVLRKVVEESGAYPTHEGAEMLLRDFAPPLDQYAKELGEALVNGPVSTVSSSI